MFGMFFSNEEIIIDNTNIINNIEHYIKIMKEILKEEKITERNLKKFKELNEEIYSFLLTNKMVNNTIGLKEEDFNNLIKELKDSLENIYTLIDFDILTFSFEIQIYLLNILKGKL